MTRAALALLCATAACAPDARIYTDVTVGFDVFPPTDELLPLNARITLVRRRGEAEDTPVDLTFAQSGAPVPVDVVGRALAARQEAFVVAPALEANAEVTITTDVGDGRPVDRAWRVDDVEDASAPVVEDGPITFTDSAGFGLGEATGIEVVIRSQPTVDGSLYLLRLAGDVDALLLPIDAFDASSEPPLHVLRLPGGDARRLCIDAFAVDVAGNETALASAFCGDIGP